MGESQRHVLRARSRHGQFLKGQPFVKVNWADGFDEKGRPNPGSRHGADEGRHADLSGQSGRHELVQPVVQPAHRLFYVPAWENTSTTYIKGDTPPEFREGQGFTGLFPRPGPRTDDVHSASRRSIRRPA